MPQVLPDCEVSERVIKRRLWGWFFNNQEKLDLIQLSID